MLLLQVSDYVMGNFECVVAYFFPLCSRSPIWSRRAYGLMICSHLFWWDNTRKRQFRKLALGCRGRRARGPLLPSQKVVFRFLTGQLMRYNVLNQAIK